MSTRGKSQDKELVLIYLLNIAVVTFLLLPTWYTNFLFIHTNYIKLNCVNEQEICVSIW